MAGRHHWLDGRESEWTPGVCDGQGGLACCDSWGCKESDTTEWPELNWTELKLDDLKQHKFIVSQFWELKVWNQGVIRAVFPPKPVQEIPFFFFLFRARGIGDLSFLLRDWICVSFTGSTDHQGSPRRLLSCGLLELLVSAGDPRPPLSSGASLSPCLCFHSTVYPVHLHIVFPLCVSVSKFLPSYQDNSHIGLGIHLTPVGP